MAKITDLWSGNVVRSSKRLLILLLRDNTLSSENSQVNIFWATDDYASVENGRHSYYDQIMPNDVAHDDCNIILPQVLKRRDARSLRAKCKAEVFTPAWLCNAQNNLVDEAWFGKRGVFNAEKYEEECIPDWIVNAQCVTFPKGKTWLDYVRARRMEMACGEAPYIASRYDVTNGQPIELERRVGMLDRKFRVIKENTGAAYNKANRRQWLRKAYQALQSVYGFDWQGDNVFLARENLLCTFYDYYVDKWGRAPYIETMEKAAVIISWNIWQMDGTTFAIPTREDSMQSCNNRTLCKVKEWHSTDTLSGKDILFKDIIDKSRYDKL